MTEYYSLLGAPVKVRMPFGSDSLRAKSLDVVSSFYAPSTYVAKELTAMSAETNMIAARVFSWNDMTVDHPGNLIDRRRIIGQQMMISHVTLHQGFQVLPHSHENEQFAVVLSGRMRFTVTDPQSNEVHEHILAAGQVLWFPSNVVHSATAEETSVILDLFSPVSQLTGVDHATVN